MAASQSSIPSSVRKVNSSAFKAPFDGGSGGNSLASTSSRPRPPNFPGSSAPGCSDGEVSTEYRGCIDEDDIVIAVMGPTGAGKSSFVNKAAGKMDVVIGDNLKSQTRKVQPVRCTHPNGRRNVVLVDTPGFDDTQLSDLQILRIIAEWLRQTYESNIKLSGILYLHRISDPRMAGTPLRNLVVFKDLCGEDNLKNIILVTTMWDETEDVSVGSRREEELRAIYWKGMIRLGSHTCRFQGTRESAWEIIDRLDLEGPHQKRVPLQIQQEMVDRHLPYEKTTPVKTLLLFPVAEMKKIWSWLRVGTRRAFGAGKPSVNLQQHPLSRSSRWRTNSSATGRSAVSPMDSSNNLSPTRSAATGCNVHGRQDTLSVMITALRLVHQVADVAAIPMVRGAIETILHTAQLIEAMGGTHHAITQVIEYAGRLLEEIVQFTAKYKLSKDMKKTLSSFTKELNHLRDVVMKISSRSDNTRFLYDADIQVIAMCTSSIREIYNRIEVKLTMDNREAMGRLENQLRELYNSTVLRQCQCGTSVLREVPQEAELSEQHSMTTGQS